MELRPVALDHAVLRVADVERSLRFFQDVLGAGPVRVEEWRRGEAPFPSVRISEQSILDLIPYGQGHGPAAAPDQRLDHICLVIEPCDLDRLAADLRDAGVDVRSGPSEVFGARGMGRSVYIGDPDGLTLELRVYPAG